MEEDETSGFEDWFCCVEVLLYSDDAVVCVEEGEFYAAGLLEFLVCCSEFEG